jgi:hypothetical protein
MLISGLGPTVPELGIEEFGIKPVEKTQFSMVLPEIMESLKKSNDQVRQLNF